MGVSSCRAERSPWLQPISSCVICGDGGNGIPGRRRLYCNRRLVSWGYSRIGVSDIIPGRYNLAHVIGFRPFYACTMRGGAVNRFLLKALPVIACLSPVVFAAGANTKEPVGGKPVLFESDVASILRSRCWKCHGLE